MMFVQIAGRLGADPETRFAPSGQKIITFRMAVNVRRKGQDKTVWWRVTVFGDRFDRMVPYWKKGSALIVSGSMNPPEKYQNREGSTEFSLEIVASEIIFNPFGGAKEGEAGEGAAAGQSAFRAGYEEDMGTSAGSFGGQGFIPQTAGQFQPGQFQPRQSSFAGITAGAGAAQQEFGEDEPPF